MTTPALQYPPRQDQTMNPEELTNDELIDAVIHLMFGRGSEELEGAVLEEIRKRSARLREHIAALPPGARIQ